VKGRAVELCSGMGGIGVALRSRGYDVARAFDSWDQTVAVYNHNFGEESAEVCNLLSPSGRARIVDLARELGEVELVAPGPPCKGFSQLRKLHELYKLAAGDSDGRAIGGC
jgi:site-specific DNA-cytosine methylase